MAPIEYQVVKQHGRSQDNPEIEVIERFDKRSEALEKVGEVDSGSNEYFGIRTLNKVTMAQNLTTLTKSDLEAVIENPRTKRAALKFYHEYEDGERSEESLIQEIQRLGEMVAA